MSKPAEIAAGHALYEDSCEAYAAKDIPWDCLDEDAKRRWIRRGMAIVRAYERASWRPIAPDDPTDRTFLMSYPHKGGGWSEPYECKLWQLGEPRYKPEMLRIRDMPGGPEE